tara:strand:- start:2497 stop:3213 length:717 start_codon:yes stop_codon:yes gene_type:complete
MDNTIRCVIIDDEPRAIQNLEIILKQYCTDVEIVGKAFNVGDGIKIIEGNNPDAAFLDIQLASGTSFDILKQIDHSELQIIFVTAYSEYALDAFKAAATDYIMKPIDVEAVEEAIRRVRNNLRINQDGSKTTLELKIKSSDGIEIISADEISFIEADGAYSVFHLINESKITTSKNLKHWENTLEKDASFLRIHHSCILNTNCIKEFDSSNNQVILKSGEMLQVSRRKKNALLETIGV